MNKETPSDAATTRPYRSPLRAARSDRTRARILDAVAAGMLAGAADALSADALAARAGVERRTVFRHFPDRAALLAAFWDWIDARLGERSLPSRPEDFATLPPAMFEAFDRETALVRASLRDPAGRAMRLARVPARVAAFRAALAPALAGVGEADAKRVEAAAHALYSAAAWETLTDYLGLSGREAGEAAAWIIGAALDRARARPREESMTIRATRPGEAEALWVLGDRVRFMGALDGTALEAIEVEVPPGSGTPPHRHPSPEIFRVLSGEVAFGVFGDGAPREIVAGPGTVVTVPSGAGHNYVARGAEPASMLVVMERALADFFREVGRPEPPAGPPDEAALEAVAAACARRGIELLAPVSDGSG